ncbi:MAG: carboxypeptidase-like regulatory domain-containing protein [Bryobacteraceae bacterium]
MNCLAKWCICLLLAHAAFARQSSQPAETLAIIEGHVINGLSGEPLRKALVTLESSKQGHDSTLVSTTDDAGHFRFADIPAGTYHLNVQKRGFLDRSFGQLKPNDDETLLKIVAGDRIGDITLRLFPGGTISGQITDADGDPDPNVTVVFRSQQRIGGAIRTFQARQTHTNEEGEYRFNGLSPGTYYVAASAGDWGDAVKQIPVDSSGKITKLRDLATFYPAALSLADAQGVSVDGGQEQSGIDIRIRRAATLSIKGKIAGTGPPLSTYSISARVEDGIGWTSESGEILPNGDFVFKELPPGKRLLTLLDNGPNGLQTIGKTEVNLTDQDVTGVVITPFKPAQVRARGDRG